ncbi:hypothetical protein [Pseudoxanthomonas sp. PXM01]|uniref:hypothetical protein n=1 Tax=Pseudoxanthomonas sp. PXM01 TaxID=2769295 RepID=UPI00177FC38B|nr:hypothetical protein [Pseudoxanthomonas sp. PXM01]MBD9469142.1 hypothetical protein [Pseudoxanthomonas sp. PXM01]
MHADDGARRYSGTCEILRLSFLTLREKSAASKERAPVSVGARHDQLILSRDRLCPARSNACRPHAPRHTISQWRIALSCAWRNRHPHRRIANSLRSYTRVAAKSGAPLVGYIHEPSERAMKSTTLDEGGSRSSLHV